MWIPAGRRLYRKTANKIELWVDYSKRDDDDLRKYERLGEPTESLEPSPKTNAWPLEARSMRDRHRGEILKEARNSINTLQRTWSYWASLASKKELVSLMMQDATRKMISRCETCTSASDPSDCEFCQVNVEEGIKIIEENLEGWLRILWQNEVRSHFIRMYDRTIPRWKELSSDKQREFLLLHNLEAPIDWHERLSQGECTQQEFDCFFSVKNVCSSYAFYTLRPFWDKFHYQRMRKLARQLRALAEQCANLVGKLCAAGTQTALAMRERKLLCTSRGGLANEQHFYSIYIAHISTIAPHLARIKALVKDTIHNRGGRQYATVP